MDGARHREDLWLALSVTGYQKNPTQALQAPQNTGRGSPLGTPSGLHYPCDPQKAGSDSRRAR
jgi:hypothetical protein